MEIISLYPSGMFLNFILTSEEVEKIEEAVNAVIQLPVKRFFLI